MAVVSAVACGRTSFGALHDAGGPDRAGTGGTSGTGGVYGSSAVTKPSAVWPSFGRDPQGTRRSPADTSRNKGLLKWRYEQYSGYRSLPSPVIGADGTVYFATNMGGSGLYAITEDDTGTGGVFRWFYRDTRSNGYLYGYSPTIGGDGTVYVIGKGLEAIVAPAEGRDGVLKWSDTTVGVGFSPTITADGTLYVGTWAGLKVISPLASGIGGLLKWSYENVSAASPPAVGTDGTVYLASLGGNVCAISPPASGATGVLAWSYETAEDVRSIAIGTDATVYAFSREGNLFAISPPESGTSGVLKWSYKTDGPSPADFTPSPAIGPDGTVYVVGSYTLYALSPPASGTRGVLKWSYAPGAPVLSSPSVGGDGTVFVCWTDGNLYAFTGGGELRWSFDAGCADASPAIGADGTVYVLGQNGLYAIH